MKKRLLSLFLTFSMLLTFFPVGTVTVFASDSPMAYTDGSYQFILNADNTATITKYTGNEHRIKMLKHILYQKSETGYSAITSTS